MTKQLINYGNNLITTFPLDHLPPLFSLHGGVLHVSLQCDVPLFSLHDGGPLFSLPVLICE